jgi:hypothetical protein
MDLAVGVAILIVRVYLGSGLSAPGLAAAEAEARVLMHRAGILLSFVTCGAAGQAPEDAALCAGPLAPHEVVLRLQAGPPSPDEGAGEPVMGESLIGRGSGATVLATVFPDRVSRLASRAGVDGGRLLGRAMAHELGHLLLNRPVHAARGIMRAAWAPRELRRDLPSDWVFLPSDAAAMRASVVRREVRRLARLDAGPVPHAQRHSGAGSARAAYR